MTYYSDLYCPDRQHTSWSLFDKAQQELRLYHLVNLENLKYYSLDRQNFTEKFY